MVFLFSFCGFLMRTPGIEILPSSPVSQSNTVFTKILISIQRLGLDILQIYRADSPTNEVESVFN